MKTLLLSIFLLSSSLHSLDVDQVTHHAMSTFDVPGIAIGVIQDGKIVHSKGYGLRDLKRNLPVNNRTLFAIGSTTKAFTTYVIDELVKEGVLDWDLPVINYVPELQMFDDRTTKELTLRDLVTHRTGLPSHDWLLCRTDLSRHDFIPLLDQFQPVKAFREDILYNNLMYVVAAIVLERASDQSWEEHVHKRILKPLKMKHSNFSIAKTKKMRNHAKPVFNNQQIDFMPALHAGPAGGINSNVCELLTWIQHQLELKDSPCHQLQAQGQLEGEPEMDGYALGWQVRHYNNEKLVYHTGVIGGSTCQVMLIPEKNHGIVILTNSLNGQWAFRAIINDLLDQMLGCETTDWVDHFQEKFEQQKNQFASYKQGSPPAPLGSYVGSYHHPAYGSLDVVEKDEDLFISYYDVLIPLVHSKQGLFFGSLDHLGLVLPFQFLSEKAGPVAEVHVPCIKDHPLVPFKKEILIK